MRPFGKGGAHDIMSPANRPSSFFVKRLDVSSPKVGAEGEIVGETIGHPPFLKGGPRGIMMNRRPVKARCRAPIARLHDTAGRAAGFGTSLKARGAMPSKTTI
jgi:hypothetical protein